MHTLLRRLESLQAAHHGVDEIFVGDVELGAQLAGSGFVPAQPSTNPATGYPVQPASSPHRFDPE